LFATKALTTSAVNSMMFASLKAPSAFLIRCHGATTRDGL
jgi:hypothetical protein